MEIRMWHKEIDVPMVTIDDFSGTVRNATVHKTGCGRLRDRGTLWNDEAAGVLIV